LKILITTSTPFHLVHIARELSNKGNDVTMIGYMPKWKMKRYDLGKAKYKSLFWYCPPLFLLALQHKFPKLQRSIVFGIMSFVDKLHKFTITKCDILIGLSGVSVESIKYAKKKYNAITILERGSAHVTLQNELVSYSLPPNYIKRELIGYELADYISIPSKFSENSFIIQGIKQEKLFINNYGVDLSKFFIEENISKNKRNVNKYNGLFIGGWSYQKGVDYLIEAIKLEEKLQITHIGSNGGYDFPNHDRLISLGHISNNELRTHIKNYDFLILPSRQDGFGMVLLEALACGVPIITSENTGGPDLHEKITNKNSVTIIEKLSSKTIIEAIKSLYSKNSFDNVFNEIDKQYFTWQSYGERYNNFIKGLKK
jgi:glycosyltransferase involved in cell wall biosynthesis